jgi:hypothetical protein
MVKSPCLLLQSPIVNGEKSRMPGPDGSRGSREIQPSSSKHVREAEDLEARMVGRSWCCMGNFHQKKRKMKSNGLCIAALNGILYIIYIYIYPLIQRPRKIKAHQNVPLKQGSMVKPRFCTSCKIHNIHIQLKRVLFSSRSSHERLITSI